MLKHGGRLRQASTEYRMPLSDWTDLSTGINPNGWPVPLLPTSAWARLPKEDDGLLETAQTYCGARSLLPVARAILVRRFDAPASLRFGLPGSEGSWLRLGHALAAVAA